MKSRTSFFNGTALRKDITRFAPVWGLYSVFLLLMLLLQYQSGNWGFHDALLDTINGGGLLVAVNLIYAGTCAALLFGDLFNSRMCNMLHAMPMRREGWFLTHVTAGLLFSLVPNVLYTCVAMPLLGSNWDFALLWLAIMSLEYLFFFGVGCFAALCVGSRFAMLTVYGIVNFLSVLAYLLVYTLYRPVLYGLTVESSWFQFFCPAAQLGSSDFFETSYVNLISSYRQQIDAVCWDTWYYLFAVAALGLLFMGLALWLYRRRAMESAGDFIAFRPLRPVFLVIFTLSVGTLMYSFAELTSGSLGYVFLAVGLVVGFFTGRMLLERTVKVFKPKALLGFGILIAVLFASIGLTWLDPLGIVNYVPKAEEVKRISIATSDGVYEYNVNGNQYRLTDREDVETILEMHRQILTYRAEDSFHTVTLYLTYELQNGSTVQRSYPVLVDSEAGETLKGYLSDWRYVFHVGWEWEALVSRVSTWNRDKGGGREYWAGLMEAIRLDCEAGNFAQSWNFHWDDDFEYWLEIQYRADNGLPASVDLRVYSCCKNVIRYLEENGYYDYYEDYTIYD